MKEIGDESTRRNFQIKLNGFTIDWADFQEDGIRIEVFGKSGSGKSHAVKVILEEFLKWDIPIVVIDPEGEYASFKDICKMIVLGGKYQDLPLEPQVLPSVIDLVFKQKINLIFDLSELVGTKSRSVIAAQIQEELFNAATKYRRTKYERLLVYCIDEAQLTAPQTKNKATADSAAIAIDIAQRGRKRGFIPIFVMQRPVNVDKDILTQCNVHLMGQLEFPTDIVYVKKLFHDDRITQSAIESLKQEFFIKVGSTFEKIRFRSLSVEDLGGTVQPGSSREFVLPAAETDAALSTVITELLEQIQRTKCEEQTERDHISQLESNIKEKDQQLRSLQKELDLERQAAKIIKKIDLQLKDIPAETRGTGKELEELQNEIQSLRETMNSLQQLKESPDGSTAIITNHVKMFPIKINGVNIQTGEIIGNNLAKLFLDEMNTIDRELFFALQGENETSKTKIVKFIPGKGKRTLWPALEKLVRLELVTKTRRGAASFYTAKNYRALLE